MEFLPLSFLPPPPLLCWCNTAGGGSAGSAGSDAAGGGTAAGLLLPLAAAALCCRLLRASRTSASSRVALVCWKEGREEREFQVGGVSSCRTSFIESFIERDVLEFLCSN